MTQEVLEIVLLVCVLAGCWGVASWLARPCLFVPHEFHFRFIPGVRSYLECVNCGKETQGWDVSGKTKPIPVVMIERDWLRCSVFTKTGGER